MSIRPLISTANYRHKKARILEECWGRVCGGNCVGLVEEEEDVEIESESIRRILMIQRKRYVSYDTLRKDLVPCERPGASYYNCRSGGVANPYTRGCEVIAGCARNIKDIKT
uniref:Uncharacterized protein n=1 Tax=Kalanchoe fedtschenkoi TaxID=63787 RepID=A0A7N0ZS53_KALFE